MTDTARLQTLQTPTPSQSQTLVETTTNTRTQEEAVIAGSIRLQGGDINQRRVQWAENVEDNEGLNRKKSKSVYSHVYKLPYGFIHCDPYVIP
jgi:protein phosphatase 1 regulatory subunit 11